MDEELKPCPICHREAQQSLCSGLVSCAYEDCPAFLLAVFPENWNARAQLPSQGGEAVEVVAWVTQSGFMHKDKDVAETHPVTKHTCKVEPLMTVAQHKRIMASAPQHDAELVELLRSCADEFRGVTMSRDLPQRIDAKLATLSAKNEGGKA